ncbi:unnamed protein product [Anisakis simplex]|uniref:rRNA adenine N(6)-methyltransferase n=1 Tax=Anisakis simplex TaxID=6269 RepID=A0A0M3JWU6_ANISI|nr:unnamed protein product [Anisakis simplex]
MATNFSRLSPMPALRDFIHMYKLRAKKILSQNYLMDMNLTRKIVRSAGIQEGDCVVEIGPGPGGITRAVIEMNCNRLDAIEIDKRFLPPLQHLTEASGTRLFVHHADALKTDIGNIWKNSNDLSLDMNRAAWNDECPRLHVIGNLPFHIASPLIIKYLREMHNRTSAWSYGRVPLTLTFQMEVARRICAPIDSDYRARISIMSNFVSVPSILFQIPGNCFVPKPKVDLVEKICRHVFHYRQKYVIKCLRTLYPPTLSDSLSHELLSECRIAPSTISIQLGMEQFADICYAYEEQCKRYPGLFLYDYTKPNRELDHLSRLANALPPLYSFRDSFRSVNNGVSLSNSESIFH